MQYCRWLEGTLQEASSRGKARLVLGARQTGKSTLFRHIAGQGDVLVDLQERSERMRLLRDPAVLSRRLLTPARDHTHVLIDEVQKVPELLDEIQLILDRHPGRFTFSLTGSSARRLRRGRTNLLPGRVHRHTLTRVCLWEEGGRSRGTVLSRPSSLAGTPFPARSLEETLVLGSLPAAFVEGWGFRRTLESYADVYIEEEVLREMAARNLGEYARFLQLAAVESGKPINLTRISQDTGIALSTIRGFYSVLEDTLLGFTVAPFSRAARSRMVRTSRFYFFDVGVRNAVAGLPLEPPLLVSEGGHLLEHWVGCELASRVAYLGRGHRLSFFRTSGGAEVDFIVETPDEVIPVEVKFTANPRPADARGVELFLSAHPGLASRGYVVCRVSQPEQLTERVAAIGWADL